MRIIDKQKDFYDFYQGMYRDDSITFDCTDSFLLTKEIMRDHLWMARRHGQWWWQKGRYHYPEHCFTLMQVGNTFWLFLVRMVDSSTYNDDKPIDYDAYIVTTWKDYDLPRKLLRLDIIEFSPDLTRKITEFDRKRGCQYDIGEILARESDLIKAINHGEYTVLNSINKHVYRKDGGEKIEKHIPLLKASGINQVVDPLDIYLAIEEYFSLEKTASERTESVGLSNDEKVENHGFDLKTSFRGK